MQLDTQDPGQRFALLYQLSQTFNSSLNLQEVLDLVMDEVVKALKAERGFVALREQEGQLQFRSARGIDQTTIDDPEFKISRGVVENVLQTGEGVCVSDAQLDDRFRARQSVLNLKLRSILCAPLILKENILGVIYIDNNIIAGIFTQNDLDLLNAIASSAAIAIENARLYQVAVEKGRMERELQMAYRVQSSLIPEEIPQFPGWEFAACWHPAREVSGDFYDFISTQVDRMNFVIADVTDKGMPAALFMALTRSLVRSSLDLSGTLAESVTRANRLICADSTLSMPVTLFTFQLCLTTGVLSYVNAGHNPPIYFQAKEEQFIDLTRTGIFLGFDEEAHYEEVPISMEPGDFVVCYTDGVLDAINAKGEAYEMDRFQKKIAENKNLSAYDLLAEIEKSVHDFIGEAQLYDDLTVLIVRRS